ncbi:MAG: hypothetical protein OEY28_02300 [Nitrospira sp.]|nr:hypothetical protein [Nitrospira sp.]
MFSPDAESFQSAQTTRSDSSGTIVLSSSCRLLFIDRNAVALLNVLDSDFPAQNGEQGLPSCIMTIAKEVIAASPAIHVHSHGMGARVRRILGSPEQPVRVQGFAISNPAQLDMRIVLVLSQSNGTIVQGR